MHRINLLRNRSHLHPWFTSLYTHVLPVRSDHLENRIFSFRIRLVHERYFSSLYLMTSAQNFIPPRATVLSADVQTADRAKSRGHQVRGQHHGAARDDGGDATSRRDHRHGEAARGQRLRPNAERGDRGVRGNVARDTRVTRATGERTGTGERRELIVGAFVFACRSLAGRETTGFDACRMINISQCEISERSEQYVLTLYNPLSRPVAENVRLPVPGDTAYTVVDPDGRAVAVQFVPVPAPVLRVPGRRSSATAELVFRADDLPPLGYKSYLITRQTDSLNQGGARTKRWSSLAEEPTAGEPSADIGDSVRTQTAARTGRRTVTYVPTRLSSPTPDLPSGSTAGPIGNY